MSNRRICILVPLLCATIVATAGCATTEESSAVTREQPKVVREVREDGTVVLHKTVGDISLPDQPRQSRSNWRCRVARALHAGLMIYANPNLAAVYVASALD